MGWVFRTATIALALACALAVAAPPVSAQERSTTRAGCRLPPGADRIPLFRPRINVGEEFARPGEDVRWLGEAYATIAGGTLYLVAFKAPAIHYLDAGIAARTVVASAARP